MSIFGFFFEIILRGGGVWIAVAPTPRNKQGKYEEVLVNYAKSLAVIRKIFGTDENSSISGTLNNIASV